MSLLRFLFVLFPFFSAALQHYKQMDIGNSACRLGTFSGITEQSRTAGLPFANPKKGVKNYY